MRRSFIADHSPSADEGTVDLTPLIDVVFVVLILFIFLAPLLEIDRIQLATAPQIKHHTPTALQDNAPFKIHVHLDNSIWVNKALIAPEDLLAHFRTIKELIPHATPQVYHDKEAFFGTYQGIKQALEGAGFEEMDLILQPSA